MSAPGEIVRDSLAGWAARDMDRMVAEWAPDIVWDEITIEDPVTLEKPWSFTFAWRRMPGYTLLEYICEDNREFADEQGHQRINFGSKKCIRIHLTDPVARQGGCQTSASDVGVGR